MYSFNQISQLNSDKINVSINLNHTKCVVNKLWVNASHHQKLEAIALGSYNDTSSFDEVINTGRIDIQTAVVLSHVFESDPYFIIGLSEKDSGYDEKVLCDFIDSYSRSVNYDKSPAINLLDTSQRAKDILIDLSETIFNAIEISEQSFILNESIDIINKLYLEAQSENLTAIIKISLIRKILEY